VATRHRVVEARIGDVDGRALPGAAVGQRDRVAGLHAAGRAVVVDREGAAALVEVLDADHDAGQLDAGRVGPVLHVVVVDVEVDGARGGALGGLAADGRGRGRPLRLVLV